MWNRDQPEGVSLPRNPTPASGAGESKNHVASLGPSITIKGTLTGEEDLLIEGRLEGEVALHKQHVTIGRNAPRHSGLLVTGENTVDQVDMPSAKKVTIDQNILQEQLQMLVAYP